MRRSALLAVLAAAATAASATAAPADVAAPRVSANWAGYAIAAPPGAAPLSFRDATGSWVQPRASCVPGAATASAFWVGIGGYAESGASLQQLGTEADCDDRGRASYHAWWELAPAAPVAIPLRIAAGDRITAAVVVDGRRVTISLRNVSRGTRFTKTLTAARPLDVGSAEWIAEAPTACTAAGRCGGLPLTDFGTVVFSRAAAIADGHAGTIADPAWQATPIALDSRAATGLGVRGRPRPPRQSRLFGGLPSGLAPDGRGFTVAAQVTD